MDYQHNFKKKFGQNFLNDENIINKIVNTSIMLYKLEHAACHHRDDD